MQMTSSDYAVLGWFRRLGRTAFGALLLGAVLGTTLGFLITPTPALASSRAAQGSPQAWEGSYGTSLHLEIERLSSRGYSEVPVEADAEVAIPALAVKAITACALGAAIGLIKAIARGSNHDYENQAEAIVCPAASGCVMGAALSVLWAVFVSLLPLKGALGAKTSLKVMMEWTTQEAVIVNLEAGAGEFILLLAEEYVHRLEEPVCMAVIQRFGGPAGWWYVANRSLISDALAQEIAPLAYASEDWVAQEMATNHPEAEDVEVAVSAAGISFATLTPDYTNVIGVERGHGLSYFDSGELAGRARDFRSTGSWMAFDMEIDADPPFATLELAFVSTEGDPGEAHVYVNDSHVGSFTVAASGLTEIEVPVAESMRRGVNTVTIERSSNNLLGGIGLVTASVLTVGAGAPDVGGVSPSLTSSTSQAAPGESYALSWTAVPNAERYYVESSRDGSFTDLMPQVVDSTSTNRVSYISGDTIRHRVRANNSGYSNVVEVQIGAAPPGPSTIQVSPSSLELNGVAEYGSVYRRLAVSAPGLGLFEWRAIPTDAEITPQRWLTVTAGSGMSSDSIQVRANSSSLPVGTYEEALLVTSPQIPGDTAVVPIRFVVREGFHDPEIEWELTGFRWLRWDIHDRQDDRREIEWTIRHVGTRFLPQDPNYDDPYMSEVFWSPHPWLYMPDYNQIPTYDFVNVDRSVAVGQSVTLRDYSMAPEWVWETGEAYLFFVTGTNDQIFRGLWNDTVRAGTPNVQMERITFPRDPRIAISPEAIDIQVPVGDSSQFQLSIANAGDGALNWQVSHPGAVRLSEGSGTAPGTISGWAYGGETPGESTHVLAFTSNGGNRQVPLRIETVGGPPVEGIRLEPSEPRVAVGGEITVEATAEDGFGVPLAGVVPDLISSAPAVLLAVGADRFEGVAAGEAWVVGRFGSVSDSVLITVAPQRPEVPTFSLSSYTAAATWGDENAFSLVLPDELFGAPSGPVEVVLRWDPTMLEVQLSEELWLDGASAIDTDSLHLGRVLAFGEVDPARWTSTPGEVVVGTVTPRGAWGEEAQVMTQASFFEGQVVVDFGQTITTVTLNPGSAAIRLESDQSTLRPGDSISVGLTLEQGNLVPRVGAVSGNLQWQEGAFEVVRVESGAFGGQFDWSVSSEGGIDQLTWAIIHTNPPSTPEVGLLDVVLRVVGTDADTVSIEANLTEVVDLELFRNILEWTQPPQPLSLDVVRGIWGDPSGTGTISALDALICLSAVVGSDVSDFDVAACDVNGSGTVGAVDALIILTYVVGGDTSGFRVGTPR